MGAAAGPDGLPYAGGLPVNIIVGCERSGMVRDALRRLGHKAYSCDLGGVAPGGEFPEFHLFGDVLGYLDGGPDGPWDMGIFFPDCTFLTNSAAWAYGDPDFDRYPGVGYHQKIKPGTLVGSDRRAARENAIVFVDKLWRAGIAKVAIENPRGYLGTMWRPPSQIIHPPQFGDDASKATCLWLRNLSKLRPTGWAAPRMDNLPLFGGTASRPRWSNQTDNGQNRLSPSEDRAMLRAGTYPGIADAMAMQWAGDICKI